MNSKNKAVIYHMLDNIEFRLNDRLNSRKKFDYGGDYTNDRESFVKYNIEDNNLTSGQSKHSVEDEVKKLVQKEIEGLLSSAKMELKSILEGYMRDVGDMRYVRSEVNIIKDSVNENKKLILIFQDEIEKKMKENNSVMNANANSNNDSSKNNIEHKDHIENKDFEELKKHNEVLCRKIEDLENIQNNMKKEIHPLKQAIEANKQFYENKIEEIELNNYNMRSKLESEIQILKNTQDNLLNEVPDIQELTKSISTQISTYFQPKFDELDNHNSELKEYIQTMNTNIDGFQKKTESRMEKLEILKENLESMNWNYQNIKQDCDKFLDSINLNAVTEQERIKIIEKQVSIKEEIKNSVSPSVVNKFEHLNHSNNHHDVENNDNIPETIQEDTNLPVNKKDNDIEESIKEELFIQSASDNIPEVAESNYGMTSEFNQNLKFLEESKNKKDVDSIEEIFVEDLDDFDKESDHDEVEDIIYRNDDKRNTEIKSRSLKNLLNNENFK